MKVQLKEKFSTAMDEGTTQDFFGVPFTCVHNKDVATPDKPTLFVAEWFADIPKKEADLMIKARRVDAVQGSKDDDKE